uniref:Uncharacterized protein n=1 Tax=Mycoplasma suis TaxID=57372 RepID=Q8KM79_9MOLU|nr:hypothetical protein [Mycoplasma suis]
MCVHRHFSKKLAITFWVYEEWCFSPSACRLGLWLSCHSRDPWWGEGGLTPKRISGKETFQPVACKGRESSRLTPANIRS